MELYSTGPVPIQQERERKLCRVIKGYLVEKSTSHDIQM